MVFIEKNRARRGFVFVEIVRQIVAVVSIDHRQVEHIVNRYPRHKVVVLRVQRLHLRQRLAAHRVIHGGFDRVLRGRGGRLRRRSLRRVLRLDRRRFGRLCRFSRLRIFGLHLRAVQGGKPGFQPARLHIAPPETRQLIRAPQRHAGKYRHRSLSRRHTESTLLSAPADGKSAKLFFPLRLLFPFSPVSPPSGAR